ncbi:helix-turn-helix domain-containing protein [Sciscionella marina]|uniref:helix-turn-helix domain-containing protein n=1 Tax=Sciscionella marina TaxID=508770 RepID=UPI001F09AF6D|nr:helix-turn-helix domain-containing protein [Sciscionella marina]
MNSNNRTLVSAHRGPNYTFRQVASLLGIEQWRVHRAVRRGVLRAHRERSRLVIPAHELARVLNGGGR